MIILSLLILGSIGAFIYFRFPDWQAEKVAKTYVLNWSSGNTSQKFEDTLKPLTTDDFQSKQLKAETDAYQQRIDQGDQEKNSVQKIYLIDKRPTALEAVVYFTEANKKEHYSNPMQANVILYKSGQSWQIQNAYIMQRSDQPIPKSASDEEKKQAERAVGFQKQIKDWINSRNTGDINSFTSNFSKDATVDIYTNAFNKEQETIKKDKLNFHVDTTGVLVNSSTDRQARILVLNQQTINGTSQMIPLTLDLISEEGAWKIQKIFEAQ